MKNITLKILVVTLLMILIVLISNKVFAKYVFETSQFLIIETNLDRTPPKLNISYSTTQLTNGNVIVKITSNEKIRKIEGWKLSKDGLSITKEIETNTNQNIDVYDLAGNKSSINMNIENIDKEKPTIECTSIKNSNTSYPSYANSEKQIDIIIKLKDNIEIENVDLSKVTINVGANTTNPTLKWTKESSITNEIIYKMTLTNIKSDGILKIFFEEGFVIDKATNNNVKTEIDTKIIIDNTSPSINYSQEIIDNGKVNAILTANEKIRQLSGWNISADSKKLNKEFGSNVSYKLTVTDLAGNKTTTTVSVTGATYISLTYASHNSNIGWSYGYGNYDIAGKYSVLVNSLFKTEALAFNASGNISDDFVRGRAYVYSHWGVGSIAKCADSGMIYKYGYNPSSSSWKSMSSSDLVTIDGKKYFQFGGAGINGYTNTDINGNNPISAEIANEFHYGICGITLSLKDYTDYSIVYQIYISEVGWISAASNGEETMYSKTKPMSAFRVAIIPNSEKQSLLNTWNKDIGQKIQ